MLISAQDISKHVSLRTLFEGVGITVDQGDRIGLIGPNGAGKSTLLKILAGEIEPDEGEVVAGKSLRTVYVPQVDRFPEGTARHIVIEAAVEALSSHDRHEAEIIAEQSLGRVGFDDGHASTDAAALSGGWRKRLSLARALAACANEPDVVLLDEPTNHLDLDGIRWLERFIMPSGGASFASVFVTHDRRFLENVATRIVELSRAYPMGTLSADGNYTEFLRRKQEFLDAQLKAEQAIAGQVRQDLAWLSRGPQGRQTKAKGRIDASAARMQTLTTLKERNAAGSAGGASVDFHATDRKTRKLITAKGIGKSLGGRKLFSDVDLTLGVGSCLGLLGANGSGKTTLIRVLTGDLAPDQGTIVGADPLPRVAVFSQHRQDFEPTTSLQEALCPVSDRVEFRGRTMHVKSWSRRFLFRDEQLSQPVSSLSGGELARIHIARIMTQPADVLVLDEPTNDLDIPTLEMLEEALEGFPGALILVTHDRAMLERLATTVLRLDGRGGAHLHASLDHAIRAEDVEAAPAPPRPKAAPRPAPVRKKLSYMEQREYDQLEGRIEQAEAHVRDAEAVVADPIVQADHAKMTDACGRLTDAQAQVAALYARWEELESKLA